MKYLVIICIAALASCHISRNVQTESVNIDSIVNSVKKQSKVSFDSLQVEYKRHLAELTNIGATFTPCPPSSVPDSILNLLDSAAKYRIMLWQKDQKIQALNHVLKVNADGSFETTQQVSSLQIAKSKTEDENIALHHSLGLLEVQLDSSKAELKREQESKSKVVKETFIPWWMWLVAGLGFVLWFYKLTPKRPK